MRETSDRPEQSPADIARETIRRLALRRLPPTPEAYREIYEEVAGNRGVSGAEQVLAGFSESLSRAPGNIAALGERLQQATRERDWENCARQLERLLDLHLELAAAGAGSPAETAPAAPESRQVQLLRDLLVRTLTLALASLLRGDAALAEEAESLAHTLRNAHTEQALDQASAHLKQLCFRIGLKADDMAEEHELLLRLFQLLLENVGELVDDDAWLAGQVANVQQMLSGPISRSALIDAHRSLKEVIYKQGVLKHSLKEAKITVKNMMMTFIDRLGAVAVSTGNFHKKIDGYQRKIADARGMVELNHILDDMMQETSAAQEEALRSRDVMIAARQEVQEAEARIQDLESRLEQMSELVREDQLTGSLNRRGLDDVFEREMARSARRDSPLCIALLDLDDFKRLNDTHGHAAGDQALIHLVRVVKETLRTMDVVARFGGEEFMIVLPDTPLQEAVQTVTRVQRELTKRIFMHENQRLLITFSAGVAMRAAGEEQVSLLKRADDALYQAKRAGKNRVVAAIQNPPA